LLQHTARKRFGQNFLQDEQIIAAIINEINPRAGQHIVEIGPGQGALTAELVASGADVDAIELDRDLAEFLQQHFISYKNFHLQQADILEFDLRSIFDKKNKLRVVGNLPYNISSPLLFKLFNDLTIIDEMYFMLQHEVALRLVATTGNKEYGRMSVLAQYHCDMQIILDVPPTAFDPRPKVDSNIVYFKPRAKITEVVKDPKLLKQVATLAFNQRRKTLHNSLKTIINNEKLIKLGIDPQLRAENISVDQYVRIANNISNL